MAIKIESLQQKQNDFKEKYSKITATKSDESWYF